jgi:thioredoxin reductase
MQKEKQMTLEADTVVLAVGAKPNTIPEDISTETIEKMYSIGDCVKPRNIQTAIEDGARIALQI